MVITNLFHFIGWIIFKIVGKLFFNLKVKGQENLRDLKGGVIFIANYHSKIDPFIIGASIPISYFRRIKSFRYLSHYSNIFLKWYGLFLWLLGAYSVFPNKGDFNKSLNNTVKFLKDNQSILIFPTNNRNKYIDLEETRSGIAHLSKNLNPLIVPVFIKNTYRVKIKD